MLGCPPYLSPETINFQQKSFSGFLSDSWSLGIVLYTLIYGRYPFQHPMLSNMFVKIKLGKFHVPTSNGCGYLLSQDLRILLRSLIRGVPHERLLPHEILVHNWLSFQTESDAQYELKLKIKQHVSEAREFRLRCFSTNRQDLQSHFLEHFHSNENNSISSNSISSNEALSSTTCSSSNLNSFVNNNNFSNNNKPILLNNIRNSVNKCTHFVNTKNNQTNNKTSSDNLDNLDDCCVPVFVVEPSEIIS